MDILPFYLFFLDFYYQERFVTIDVLSPQMFCQHLHFVATDVLSPEVLFLQTFLSRTFCHRHFVNCHLVC
jgi:hypothetical protein